MSEILVPILKDTKDPFYRYKMPKIITKIEGSGNGIKTVITNMQAIAKALNRPPSYPIKYFGCELGAQVSINGDYVINGLHDQDKLMNSLYGFIRKFVLCPKCLNPETNLTVLNHNTINQKCIACGHKCVIPKNVHKLTTFIMNNPPQNEQIITPKNNHSNESNTKKTNKIVVEKDSKIHQVDEFDDDDLFLDENSIDKNERIKLFTDYLIEKKNSDQLMQTSCHVDLYKEAERLMVKSKAALILCEILFSENCLEEIKSYKKLLIKFCSNNQKAQRYFLGGIERLCGQTYKDKLFNETTKIMKELYDEDIVDEETFLEWSSKPSKKYVCKEMSKKIHEKCEPFIKWLKEAEVEEDEEEKEIKDIEKKSNDADEELLEFSHRVSGLQIESHKIMPVNANINKEEENDIDIDQI